MIRVLAHTYASHSLVIHVPHIPVITVVGSDWYYYALWTAVDRQKSSSVTTQKTMLGVRPPLNEKSFPVHRPGGLKRAYWNFFFSFKKTFFFNFSPAHSSL